MTRLPFEVVVFDKGYARKGPIGAPLSMAGELVARTEGEVGSLEFTVPADNPRVPDLTADGARVLVRYRPEGGEFGPFMSGRVTEVQGAGSRFAPVRTFQVIDDSVVLDEVECWPNPTGTASQQGDDAAYFTRTGPAETVLKQTLAPNVARQGTVLTIPATAGKGSTITVQNRFHIASERLLPAMRAAGLGVRVRQDGSTRVLEVYEPQVIAQTLTQESGIVVAGSYSIQGPTVTRVTLLAGGEGTARTVRVKIDAAREAQYGVILPATIDARDIQQDMDADPSGVAYEAELLARMDERLAEGAPKASLSASLTESGWFRYAVAYDIDSKATVKFAGAEPIEDSIRRVPFSWTPGEDVSFTPQVGEWSDLADAPLIKHVQALTRAVGNLERV